LSNEFVVVTFDPVTNLLSSMTSKVTGVTVSLTQEWLWYNSTVCNSNFGHVSDGSWGDNQNSGAYVRGCCLLLERSAYFAMFALTTPTVLGVC
jgi:hypothetical protein